LLLVFDLGKIASRIDENMSSLDR